MYVEISATVMWYANFCDFHYQQSHNLLGAFIIKQDTKFQLKIVENENFFIPILSIPTPPDSIHNPLGSLLLR